MIQPQRLVELRQFSRRQVTPRSLRNSLKAQRAQSYPSQTLHWDPDRVHHPAHHVVEPLVDHDAQNQPFPRLTQDAELAWHDPAPVNGDALPHACQRPVVGTAQGKDVILLVQSVAGVHDPVGNVPIVGEQKKAFCVPVQPPDRIDTLRHIDQIHHGPPAALIAGGGDVAGWLVEKNRAGALRAEQPAVNANLGAQRVDLGAKFRHRLTVYSDSSGADQFLCRTARTCAASGHHTLQPLHGASPPPSIGSLRDRTGTNDSR